MQSAQSESKNRHEDENEAFLQLGFVLACEYDSFYIIRTEDYSYIQYCPDRWRKMLLKRGEGADFMTAIQKQCETSVAPEDKAEFLELFSKEHLTESIERNETFTAHVKFCIEGSAMYYDIKVLPFAAPEKIVVCVRNADMQVRREIRINAERKAYQSIVDALSYRYEVIYYVNLLTGEYSEYNASENYATLKVGKTGKDFFRDTQRNLKRDIYPDDYQMMRDAMEPDHLLGTIRENGSASINYRLMFGDTPKHVTLYATHPTDDPLHLIIAVADVDADVKREMSYREALGSAMMLATQDSLTGLKNKHAYAQKESELNQRIASHEPAVFAVVVCDVNGLKKVNDTQGHVAGDAYIRCAGQLICATFSHSPVYRIGGDEFVVMLEGRDYENRIPLMQKLGRQVEENSRQQQVTVACGISVFDPAEDNCVQDVFERADCAMYKQKKCSRYRNLSADRQQNAVAEAKTLQ